MIDYKTDLGAAVLKAVIFDLDNTLTDFARMKERAVEGARCTRPSRRRASGSRMHAIVSAADRPDSEQMRILAQLDPAAKLEIARRLREETLALKEAWLRAQHPDEDDDAIRRRLRAWQLYGRAWLH